MFNVDAWFDPNLWIKKQDFWSTMASEAVHRGLVKREEVSWECGRTFSNERAMPLTQYSYRSEHEMAHYLQCDDKDVLDPFYGSEVFTFRKDDKAWFSDDDYFKEVEVFVIHAILMRHNEIDKATEVATYMNVSGFHRGSGQSTVLGTVSLDREPPENIRFTRSLAADCLKKWSGKIPQLEKELYRKNEIVRQQLPELHRLQGRTSGV